VPFDSAPGLGVDCARPHNSTPGHLQPVVLAKQQDQSLPGIPDILPSASRRRPSVMSVFVPLAPVRFCTFGAFVLVTWSQIDHMPRPSNRSRTVFTGDSPLKTCPLSFKRHFFRQLVCDLPQRALCGGIPSSFLEPSLRSWSHFVGIYRQKLTRSLKN
jgi:hypothetical protein